MSEIFGNGVMGGGGLTNSKLALADAQAADVRSGKKFYAGDKQIKTGTLADVTQATPAITVSAAGLITTSATQAAGVVAAGTKSATKQLTVQAAKTVTPSASAQTAAAKGVFTTGIITVAAVYAVIGVTYPSGSTCTCTNGSKTLTAKDTSGQAIFVIPSAGTWTVKAVSGSDSASKAVSITTDGQVATVTLSYWNGELYDAGNEYTAQTGGWTCVGNGVGYNAATKTNNQLYVKVQESSNVAYDRTTNKVSLTGFTKIQATVSAQTHSSSWSGNERCKLLVSANADLSDPVASAQPTTNDAQTLSLAISLTGSYYVGIKAQAGSASTASMTVTKIQLV